MRPTIRECLDYFFPTSGSGAGMWLVEEVTDGRFGWLEVHKEGASIPDQGWKLHVSASVTTALAVLHAVSPALQVAGACFKVCRSLSDLSFLNLGKAGLEQVGKFITVYPETEDGLVALAQDLAERTAGLVGPAIPSDRPMRAESPVHYRYGAFAPLTYQDGLGRVIHAIRSPSGELVPDDRTTGFRPPAWAVDPFVQRAILAPYSAPTSLIAGRYLPLSTLHHSAKGRVLLAFDAESEDGRACVVKHARRGIFLDEGQWDAPALLRNERRVLERLVDHASWPRVYDYFESGGDAYLVLEYFEGMNLRAYTSSRAYRGLFFSPEDVTLLGLEACTLLQILHDHDVVHCDLKPGNFILTEKGDIRLVDFEGSFDARGDEGGAPLIGTRGYQSPQQSRGLVPRPSDDIYGLGSLLYFLSTNFDPSLASREGCYPERGMERMNPGIPSGLRSVIARCLEEDVARRYQSADALAHALASVTEASSPSPRPFNPPVQIESSIYRSLAEGIGDVLCGAAQPAGAGVCWRSGHTSCFGATQRDINVGASGIGLFLLDLYCETGRGDFATAAERACEWLLEFDWERDRFLPGLYVGESGVGLFTLAIGQVMQSPRHLAAAATIAGAIAANLPSSPDLFNGLSGCGIFFLVVADVLGESKWLKVAGEIGDRLIALSDAEGGDYGWTIPTGYDSLSGECYLGFAHGSAGIGHFLLELADATGSDRYADFALHVADDLVGRGLPALDDGCGLNWPDTKDGEVQSLFWCHGATGIGHFLIRAYELGGRAAHLASAERAGRLVGRGGRWLTPVQCHGLSGSIEFLLDLYQATHHTEWADHAFELADLLRSHAISQDEKSVWPSEEPTIITPDFMIGYAGVGECFLRLLRPRTRPTLLSRQFFRALRGPAGGRSVLRAMSPRPGAFTRLV
jgi:Lanthionine synthetase C-like protein/Protein kinase domain